MADRVGHDGEISPRASLGRNDREKDDSSDVHGDSVSDQDDARGFRGSIGVG